MQAMECFAGTELPIIQAPMAGVQGSTLAIAVSNAGGLGSLPCAMLSQDALIKELTTIAAHTDRPYNLNFFAHRPEPESATSKSRWLEVLSPYFQEWSIHSNDIAGGPSRAPFSKAIADLIEPFRPPVISFHFGLPEPRLLQRIKSWGSLIISTATTVDEALWLEKQGADAIIAQGLEAGGHRGSFLNSDLNTQLGTFALLPQIIDAVDLPVIAAGGIADAKGVQAVMGLGAVAAQVGTAFLLCPEATTSEVHRLALQDSRSRPTVLTNVFSGGVARGLENRAIRELGPISEAAPDFPYASSAIAPLRSAAEAAGKDDFSPLWCGQNRSGCKTLPASELTRRLAGVA
ncbi:nitronate monooxygenase [Aestuariirhabdus sp. Z084]|uniref:NAD(P)H-dependent flavin oxidoreductase n=1 Tax=Aestuariirhabdus haliotis TaxID=2918751 RepID=UPI00201B3AC0|nr:nitronate monooxygenase [Aestuariirhabdus haliotis]MCL6416547.1 nitronate monooxygenase [Aestuariirhabdus haliotis]MCL6420537.1 nitronate monooxygenase [Aestuariirhabdus haliotis]